MLSITEWCKINYLNETISVIWVLCLNKQLVTMYTWLPISKVAKKFINTKLNQISLCHNLVLLSSRLDRFLYFIFLFHNNVAHCRCFFFYPWNLHPMLFTAPRDRHSQLTLVIYRTAAMGEIIEQNDQHVTITRKTWIQLFDHQITILSLLKHLLVFLTEAPVWKSLHVDNTVLRWFFFINSSQLTESAWW